MQVTSVPTDRIAYIGFGANVIAFDRSNGEVCWSWKAPRKGTAGAVALLLERDMLVVSINGYLWGLDPMTGDECWHSPLKGKGTGVPMMVSSNHVGGNTAGAAAAAAAAATVAAAGAAAAAG
jgi:outer membrane protein assembly factor BamB